MADFENLKPFYQRASTAEERLSKLEAALAIAQNEEHLKTLSDFQSKLEVKHAKGETLAAEFGKLKFERHVDAVEEEHLKTIRDLQSQLEDAKAVAVSERKRAEKLAAENEKLVTENGELIAESEKCKYRIKHLIGAVKEDDQKLENMAVRREKDNYRINYLIRAVKEGDQKLESKSVP